MSSNNHDVRQAINDIKRIIETEDAFRSELESVVAKKVAEIKPKIKLEFGVYQQGVINNIFKEVVDEYYAAYTPDIYEREFGLYKVLSIKVDSSGEIANDTYEDFFDKYAMHPDRRGAYSWDNNRFESLFDLTFMQGYHGGAPDSEDGTHPLPGVPHYRTPHPYYSHWGEAAFHSTPPFISFRARLEFADKPGGDFDNTYRAIAEEYYDKVSEQLSNNDIPRLERKYGRL